MRYELAHDSLARQILDRISGEAKARRQAELLVARAYKRYLERQVLLTAEDLEELRPHEAAINFSPAEKKFIQESKKVLAQAARRKQQIVIGVISLLSLFLLFALWQWQRSVAGTRALQAKAAYEKGWISQAFQLARSAQKTIGIDEDARGTVAEVLQDIYASGLQRDLVHPVAVKALDINPEEEYILSITKGSDAYIWDLQGKLRYTLPHPTEVLGGGFLPWGENRESMTFSADQKVYFWDGSGQLSRTYPMPDSILGFDFNTQFNSTLLWTRSALVLLDEAGEPWTFEPPKMELIGAGFSPKGEDLLLVSPDSVISLMLQFAKLGIVKQRLNIPGAIEQASFIASDQIQLEVLVQFADSTTQIFDLNGKLDTSSYYQYLNRELRSYPLIERFAFSSPTLKRPKTLFQTDSVSVRYWSAYRKHTDRERAGTIDFYTRYDLPILNATFSPTDRYLLTASADGRVDIWDIEDGLVERFKRIRAQIRLAQFARDDAYLITSAGDKTIKIWLLKASETRDAAEILDFYEDRLLEE